MLTPEQCRAARGLLRWTQAELARRSGVGCTTIRSFEVGRHALIRANAAALERALEAAGVMLVGPDGPAAQADGHGVLLRAAGKGPRR